MESKSYMVHMNGNGVHTQDVHIINMKGKVRSDKMKIRRKRWNIRASEMSKNTLNPIRAIVDGMKITPNPEKPMIALSIGEYYRQTIDLISFPPSSMSFSKCSLCFLYVLLKEILLYSGICLQMTRFFRPWKMPLTHTSTTAMLRL